MAPEFNPDKQNDSVRISPDLTRRIFNQVTFDSFMRIVDEIKMTTLRDIFNGARSGMLGDLIEVFVQIESSDARIRGLCASRRVASSKQSGIVTTRGESDIAQQAAEFVERNLEHLKFNNVKRRMLNGRFHGVALFEKIWAKNTDGSLYIHDIKRIDHRRIRQYNEIDIVGGRDQERYGELYLINDNWVPGEKFTMDRQFVSDINPAKIVIATMSAEDGQYDLDSIMRPVARWYIIKTFVVKAWAIFAEKYGFPIPTVKLPQAEFEQNKNSIMEMLHGVGLNKFAIFFDEFEWDLKEPVRASSVEVFEKLISKADIESAIAIVGQNLTSEVTGGSFAAAKTHSEILTSFIKDDIAWLDEIINDQIVHDLVRLNFPELPLDEYPIYNSSIPEATDLKGFADAVGSLQKVMRIPVSWLHEQTQIPQPADDEDYIGGDKAMSNLMDVIDSGMT